MGWVQLLGQQDTMWPANGEAYQQSRACTGLPQCPLDPFPFSLHGDADS
jgi:hypothetical protein